MGGTPKPPAESVDERQLTGEREAVPDPYDDSENASSSGSSIGSNEGLTPSAMTDQMQIWNHTVLKGKIGNHTVGTVWKVPIWNHSMVLKGSRKIWSRRLGGPHGVEVG